MKKTTNRKKGGPGKGTSIYIDAELHALIMDMADGDTAANTLRQLLGLPRLVPKHARPRAAGVIIDELADNPGSTVNELAANAGYSTATVYSVLMTLEQAGLAVRVTGQSRPGNGRSPDHWRLMTPPDAGQAIPAPAGS